MLSLPAIPSASAMQASLPLSISAPCRRSSTETLLLMAANMVEVPEGAPPLRQAFSLTRYSSDSLTVPSLMAWNTTSAVISFIMLEGARNSSAFLSNSTLPLVASIRIAVGASPSKASSSVFFAPWTLWLAACVIPLQLTPATTDAAISQRNQRRVKTLVLQRDERVAAIGDRPLDGARSNRWNHRKQSSFRRSLRRDVVTRSQARKGGGNAIMIPSTSVEPAAAEDFARAAGVDRR